MKKNFVFLIILLILVLLGLQIYSLIQLYFVRKGITDVGDDISFQSVVLAESDKQILEKEEEIKSAIEGTKLQLEVIEKKQDINAIQEEKNFDELKVILDTQRKQAEMTRKTYESVLEGQKKKTVDIASRDNFLLQKKSEGAVFYVRKDYSNAYKTYNEILLYEEENLDIRFLRMVCLYKMNPFDQRNYKAILDECSILRLNGYTNAEIDNIENTLKQEMGEVNE